jgi:Ni/Fe-hydrogenase subunit HybB-like protein
MDMSEAKPVGGKIVTGPVTVLMLIFLASLYFLGQRFVHGIGYVTNMTDGYPWGIWITFDVVIGTAFACGGYAIALLVYVFNRGEYHPLVRPALLASVLGYTLAAVGVFFDIGRYWHMYNIFIPKYNNYNSVLLEVALCIAAYVTVLWIEFAPSFLETIKLVKLKKVLDKVLFIFIALGILLPTMHQSSLGSVMILAGSKLSPLWWTGMLPLLFLMSALFMGYGVVIFEASISSLGFGRPSETPLLAKLSEIIPKLVAFFLLIRIGDLLIRGQLGLAFRGNLQGNMFLLEILLHVVPLVLLSTEEGRKKAHLLFISACSLLLAGTLFRVNTYLIGFDPGQGWHYFPAVPEMMITFGIISLEIMMYIILVKLLPILPAHKQA